MSEATVLQKINNGYKLLALLVDPDKFDSDLVTSGILSKHSPDLLLVGGSLLVHGDVHQAVTKLKAHLPLPVWLFPGSCLHLSPAADALLFLSLVSGRNPDFLIGQHVAAAPLIKRMNLPTIPTAYMLIDGGKPTTVSYVSNTQPIPADKPDVAAATAMAAELLGMRMIYLEAGSGAAHPVPPSVISAVRQAVTLPVIAGGGIRSAEALETVYRAGADIAVIGTAWEQNPSLIAELINVRNRMNGTANRNAIL